MCELKRDVAYAVSNVTRSSTDWARGLFTVEKCWSMSTLKSDSGSLVDFSTSPGNFVDSNEMNCEMENIPHAPEYHPRDLSEGDELTLCCPLGEGSHCWS
jgi:hypothetical protein